MAANANLKFWVSRDLLTNNSQEELLLQCCVYKRGLVHKKTEHNSIHLALAKRFANHLSEKQAACDLNPATKRFVVAVQMKYGQFESSACDDVLLRSKLHKAARNCSSLIVYASIVSTGARKKDRLVLRRDFCELRPSNGETWLNYDFFGSCYQ